MLRTPGNLAGFLTVLALTGLLKFGPLAVAFPGPTWPGPRRRPHQLRRSLQRLAVYAPAEAALHDMRLIGGTTILVDGPSPGLLPRRLGFELRPRPRSLGAFGELWKNLSALGLKAVFNPRTSRRRRDLWMPMAAFLRRYSPHPKPLSRSAGKGPG